MRLHGVTCERVRARVYMSVPMYRYVHVSMHGFLFNDVAFELHIQVHADSHINAYYLARGSMYLCVFTCV